MQCAICKGDIKKDKVNFPIELEKSFILVRDVPALVCRQCGEYFLKDDVAADLEKIAEKARDSNVEIEVLRYAA